MSLGSLHERKDSKHKEHSKAGHKESHHRVMRDHSFQDNDPYVLPSMYAKRVKSENDKWDKEGRSPGSRDDSAVPSHMHGDTRNVQAGP